jgi:hypothetical protein
MSTDAPACLLLELCSLCPIEPACGRDQMLEHVGCQRRAEDGGQAAAFTVKGQPYRCWLLAQRDAKPPTA